MRDDAAIQEAVKQARHPGEVRDQALGLRGRPGLRRQDRPGRAWYGVDFANETYLPERLVFKSRGG